MLLEKSGDAVVGIHNATFVRRVCKQNSWCSAWTLAVIREITSGAVGRTSADGSTDSMLSRNTDNWKQAVDVLEKSNVMLITSPRRN